MGVSSTVNRQTYTGDGSTVSFSFPFYFFAQADINVWVYDTLLGGTTLQTLGVNYSISGTPNLQGLYSNGANIVFVSAPASTAKVVIVRNPSQVQNYTLLQNGNINSAAIVQQFDYLTLLVQRLQDQVTRTISLPDGMAPAFSGLLPSNITLNANAFPEVNSAGNGMTLSTTTPTTAPIIIPYTSLQTAGTSISLTALALPALQIITGVIIKHTVQFTGTSITALTANVGVGADPAYFINGFNLLQAVADTAFDNIAPAYIGSFANSTNITLNVTATGANLSALSAGSLSIYFTTTTV